MTPNDKILLFIPCYNCQNQITRVLKQLDGSIGPFIDEVLLVNNRSTDATEQVILQYIKDHDDLPYKIRLVRNDANYGLGGSHKVAFNYGLENHFSHLIVLHGDDQGCIQDFLPILKDKSYQNYDALLGGRFMKTSQLIGYSKFRIFGNRIFNGLFSIAMGRPIYDLGAGLNLYALESLKDNYYEKFADNLTFNCYMLLASHAYKHKIKFHPISWREEDQVSNVKMFSQAWSTLKLVAKYTLFKKRFLNKDHRINNIKAYTHQSIAYKEEKKPEGIHLVMPMGGKGYRFFSDGYTTPKPLIEIHGKPFFYWATQSIANFTKLKSMTFVVLKEHVDRFKIKDVILSYFPQAKIVVLDEVLKGAVLTCLEGVDPIQDNLPIIFNDCDHLFYAPKLYDFCLEPDPNISGGLLTFKSNEAKYSYVSYDQDGYVKETLEKVVISDDAICGAYYFKDRHTFERAAGEYLETCAYEEFFVSGVYNTLAKYKEPIVTFSVDYHLPFGTPEEYEQADKFGRFEVVAP